MLITNGTSNARASTTGARVVIRRGFAASVAIRGSITAYERDGDLFLHALAYAYPGSTTDFVVMPRLRLIRLLKRARQWEPDTWAEQLNANDRSPVARLNPQPISISGETLHVRDAVGAGVA